MIEFTAPKARSCNHVSHDPLKPVARCGGPALCDLCFDQVMKLPADEEMDDWVQRLVFGTPPPGEKPYSSFDGTANVMIACVERFRHFRIYKQHEVSYVVVIGDGDPSWQASGPTPALATCRAAVFAFRKGPITDEPAATTDNAAADNAAAHDPDQHSA